MLTALLGTATAALFGGSDFLGGLASRRASALSVTGVVYALGVVIFAIGVAVVRPTAVTQSDLWWGAGSGIAATVGVLSLYAALAIGRMGIVAPITAAIAGSGPAIFDLVRGSSVGPAQLLGLVLALAAVIVVSTITHPEDEHAMTPAALALSAASGVGFAVSLIFLSFTNPTSGLAPLLTSRVVGAAILGVALLVRRRTVVLDRGSAKLALFGGVLDAAANITMLAAIRVGPLAVASVVGSLYPVTTILLARAVLHERMHRMQIVGVSLALAAVVLTALP